MLMFGCSWKRFRGPAAMSLLVTTLLLGIGHTSASAQIPAIDPFVLQAKLPPGTSFLDRFGLSVAVSGDLLIVGAPLENVSAGAAYIFARDHEGPDGWTQVVKLTASDTHQSHSFGGSLSISGDTVIVGALGDRNSGLGSGAAYIFTRNHMGPNAWGEVTKLTAHDAASQDAFGVSVSISGDTAIIGASIKDQESGAAYIFDRHYGGPDAWGEVAKVTAADAEPFTRFGSSVSISGNRVIVGSPRDSDDGTRSGSAYIFARNRGGANAWGQVVKLTASDARERETFGASVDINGNTALVGAPDDNTANVPGAAYIFARNQGGTNAWGEVVKLTASDSAADNFFGSSVSLSGRRAVVGASGAAAAYIFARHRGGMNAWGEVGKQTNGGVDVADVFGISVSLDNDTLVVGDYGHFSILPRPDGTEQLTFRPGAAYVFVSDTDGDGLRNGIDPCPRDPLNNVAGSCQRFSTAQSPLDHILIQGDVTSETQGRRQFITATFTNTSTTAVRNPFFEVTELTGRNVLLNADEGRGRVGATLSHRTSATGSSPPVNR